MQADAYAGFEALYGTDRISEVACLAHCRRKIFDVWQATKSPIAEEALDQIAAIYAIEARARGKPAAQRVAIRTETKTLMASLLASLDAGLRRMSARSALADAFRYTSKRRVALSRFIEDGRLEADNNIAENALRGIALGRRNWTFAGSDRGGERAAAIYTIVGTAKLNGLDPEAYLRDLIGRVADGHTINRLDELLPWNIG